jgi:RNA polymerase sigma-70 factor (ECF subfamily)
MGNGDVTDVSPQDGGHGQLVQASPDLPLDFEAFYVGHQEFFHDFAEIHLGSRRTAEQVVHLFLALLQDAANRLGSGTVTLPILWWETRR